MKKYIALIFYILIYGFLCGYASPQGSFTQSIDRIINETKEDLNIGIVISDLKTGKILYSKNANRHFTPASTLKLMTAYAALETLGPHYRYQTSFIGDLHNLNSPVFTGDIYLKFTGDPTLTIDDLDNLLQQLKNLGIHKIEGDVIIDDNYAETDSWPPGMSHEDLKFCYGAPVTGIIINQNCLSATLLPSQNNQSTLFKFDKSVLSNFAHIQNYSTSYLLKGHLNPRLEAHEDNSYVIKGNIDQPIDLKIAVQNQGRYAKKIVEYLLAIHGIGYNHVSFGKTTFDQHILVTHLSPTMSELIVSLLKNSDNIITNSIFKTLTSDGNRAHSWENGTAVLKTVLKQRLNINPEQLVIYDGAGVSRYNLITPMQLMSLLNAIDRDPQTRSIFRAALPISGFDGTLKERMKLIKNKILAKTGTETSISSLAGFVETQNHRQLSFVIMVNEGISEGQKYKALEDKICTLLVKTPHCEASHKSKKRHK